MNDREARTAFIIAFGSRCERCGEPYEPSDLIIHHTKRRVQFGGDRMREIREWFATRVRPDGIEIICDVCNRKEHHYKPKNGYDDGWDLPKHPRGRIIIVLRRQIPAGKSQ